MPTKTNAMHYPTEDQIAALIDEHLADLPAEIINELAVASA